MIKRRSGKKALTMVLLSVMALIIATIACTLNTEGGQDDNGLVETQVALQLTQMAIEQQTGGETGETGNQNGENVPSSPTITPTSTATLTPTEAPDVSYEGISFSFDSAIASSVNPATIPGQNLGEDFMPGETYPTYYEFTFNNYAVGDHFHTPRIQIYPIPAYQAISQPAADTIAELQVTLVNRPSGGADTWIPFLPMWNAGQVFTAQTSYYDFQNGSGVRYLTMFAQALYPVDNSNLFYTYQGITSDGQYYISAILPITNPALPADGGATINDWEAFYNGWDTYIIETIRTLGEQSPESYFPNMILLDEMMASFKIKR